MARLLLIAGCALLLSGCFVLEELEAGEKILDQHGGRGGAASQPAEQAPPTRARRGKPEPGVLAKLQAVGDTIGDWWKELVKGPPDPNDAIVPCKVGGDIQFTRRAECLSRGGRVS